jgi:hypothetical protein
LQFEKGISISVFTLFLIFDTSSSPCCAYNICSRYISCTFSYATNIPSKLMLNMAPNLLNFVSVCSSHTGGFLRATFFFATKSVSYHILSGMVFYNTIIVFDEFYPSFLSHTSKLLWSVKI